MIAFSKEFLRRIQQPPIPLCKPSRTTIHYNCGVERIDARLNEQGGIEHLIVWTRSRKHTRPRRRFLFR